MYYPSGLVGNLPPFDILRGLENCMLSYLYIYIICFSSSACTKSAAIKVCPGSKYFILMVLAFNFPSFIKMICNIRSSFCFGRRNCQSKLWSMVHLFVWRKKSLLLIEVFIFFRPAISSCHMTEIRWAKVWFKRHTF